MFWLCIKIKDRYVRIPLLPLYILIVLLLIIVAYISLPYFSKAKYQRLNDDLTLAVENKQSEVTFEYVSSKDHINLVFNNIILSKEYFYLSKLSYVTYSNAKRTTFKLEYNDDYYQRKEELMKYIDSEINNIISQIDTSLSNVSILLQVNDYIINNYDYDYSYENYNIIDTLKNKKMTCSGYTILTKLILDKLGFENKIVCGSTKGTLSFLYSSVDHAWNLVKVDGMWYHLDITWNDTSNSLLDYFLKSDFYMQKHNHSSWKTTDYNRIVSLFNYKVGE